LPVISVYQILTVVTFHFQITGHHITVLRVPRNTKECEGDWNLQDWQITDNITGVEIAGLDNELGIWRIEK